MSKYFLSQECWEGYLLISCLLCWGAPPQKSLQRLVHGLLSVFRVPGALVGEDSVSPNFEELSLTRPFVHLHFSWDPCGLFLSGSCCLTGMQFILERFWGCLAVETLKAHPLLSPLSGTLMAELGQEAGIFPLPFPPPLLIYLRLLSLRTVCLPSSLCRRRLSVTENLRSLRSLAALVLMLGLLVTFPLPS